MFKQQKQSKYPLTDEQKNKMWSFHMMKSYYSVTKRNEAVIHATIRMDLENKRGLPLSHEERDQSSQAGVKRTGKFIGMWVGRWAGK